MGEKSEFKLLAASRPLPPLPPKATWLSVEETSPLRTPVLPLFVATSLLPTPPAPPAPTVTTVVPIGTNPV